MVGMFYRGAIFRIRNDRCLLVRLLTEATIDARLKGIETLVQRGGGGGGELDGSEAPSLTYR